jgi:cysteine-rich repeat protein
MSMRAVVLIGLVHAAAACLQPSLVLCEDGRACPDNRVCTRTGCALPYELEACIGVPLGGACVFDGVAGVCDDVCVPMGCGNGIIDLGSTETCDDGNTASTDGCSASCATEVCGNGLQDLGELCDDGNTSARDGCSTTCQREEPAWTSNDQQTGMHEREAMVADYVTTRNAIVRFGGYDRLGAITGGTFEWVGGKWRRIPTLNAPSARAMAAGAYDTGRGRLVLFGGALALGGLSNETWEFDGVDWTSIAVAGPPAMELHAMAYDPVGQRIVLNCLCTSGPTTWAYNGSSWQPINSTLVPPLRRMATMAYDPIGQRVVLFGGETNTGTELADAYALVGDQWQSITPAPGPRSWHTMTYDPTRQALVVHGGLQMNNLTSDTWMLVGSTWTEITGSAPSDIIEAAMIYEPSLGRLIRYGGWRGRPVSEMWELGPTGWTSVGGLRPEARYSAARTTDTMRDRIVMFGGYSYSLGDLDDTLVYDMAGWRALSTPTRPPATSFSGAAYDRDRDRVVLLADDQTTWELDPSNTSDPWQPITTARAVPIGPMVYDAKRKRVVAWSNTAASAAETTRVYDGVDWLQIDTTGGPAPRDYPALAYDERRERIVMFGEISGADPDVTTWEFDGSQWHAIAALPAPPKRRNASMVYDPNRQRVVLVGGNDGAGMLSDTWEFDGARWEKVFTSTAYSPREAPMAAWLPSLQGIVVDGGLDWEWTISDTWHYRWDVVAP